MKLQSNSKTQDLTFFAWGDTHFGYQQQFYKNDFRYGIIDQMNNLTGWPFPDHIGNCVQAPEFVMHCGDYINNGTNGKNDMNYYRHFMQFLKIPYYETLGNHDDSNASMRYFHNKYGGNSHSFDNI